MNLPKFFLKACVRIVFLKDMQDSIGEKGFWEKSDFYFLFKTFLHNLHF